MSALSVIRPLRPRGEGWRRLPDPPQWATMGFAGEQWLFEPRGLLVISAVEVAADTDGHSKGPEYHVSVSKSPRRRCTSQEAKWVLRQFRLEGSEEDNHVPGGFVRNFWRPVAEPLVGLECPCKAAEPAIVEDGGDYVWRGVTR